MAGHKSLKRPQLFKRHNKLFCDMVSSSLCILFLLGGITSTSVSSSLLGPARISCNASYNSPCSRVNSEWLATDVRRRMLSRSEDVQTFLQEITAGSHNMDQGFYPFVFDRVSSECVAHGLDESLVGMTMADIFATMKIGFSSSIALHQRFNAAADAGGDWVHFIWKNRSTEIGTKIAYVIDVTDRYYLGVGYNQEPLPPDLPCSDKTDSWCSINNVLSLVGKAQNRLNDAISLEQFEASLFDISYNEAAFQIDGGHYLFMYKFDGTLVAHAKLQAFFGQLMPDIFVQLERNYNDGLALHNHLVAAALGENDGWVQYQWRNKVDEPEYTKIAFVVKIEFQGEQFYAGCGYNFIMGDIVDGPLGTRCPGYNLPCALGATRQLSSHALSHSISSQLTVKQMFEAVTYDAGLKHDDYYVFMFDFDGTCVAHGLHPDFVGLTLAAVLEKTNVQSVDGAFLHDQFVTAATNGGGYVVWSGPSVPNSGFLIVSYIFQVTLEGRNYYGGVSFNHQRAPLQLDLGYGSTKNGRVIPCSRKYGSDCSEVNAQAILGQALTDLVLASSETKVRAGSPSTNITDVLTSITSGNDLYRANDFFVAVFSFDQTSCENSGQDFSGCCVAHGADSALVGKSWQEILDENKVTSIRGKDLHDQLSQEADQGGHVLEYTLANDTGSAKLMRAFSSRFRDGGKNFYLLVEYVAELPPPTCDACPPTMECIDDDQAFCAIKSEQQPFHRSVVFLVICIFAAGLPCVGFLSCWIGKRRAKAQSEAQLEQLDEQMRKLREQMEKEKLTSTQTKKLVSSLFPEKIQEQILQQLAEEENRSSSNKLASFLSDDTAEKAASRLKTGQRPIAELFPSATVIFADISGFTAWSSTREPAQVFRLLEGIYQHFDKLAKQHGVFKVETIGDCYVAVAGLPEKLDNHAVVMALFARDCLEVFNRLVKQMEVDLGPDTAGLHSGPVTAGVLKSDKARFQLFGDTVNTASSTGVPGKIHISQETANLLRNAGKDSWYIARTEKIVAKGKGEIQTHWLTLHEVFDENIMQEHFDDSKHKNERLDRLVKWVTDGLGRILKQIHGQRQASGAIRSSILPEAVSRPCGATILEEVREIIHMPSFSGQQIFDPDDIELDQKVTRQLECYVATIASMYRDNAFHNFEHAAHVTMSVLKLMSRIVAPDLQDQVTARGQVESSKKHDHTYGITSDPLTQFACAFSALIHDVDHTGVPNTQVVKENPLLALKYKGNSVAEQNSVDLSWDLLMSDAFIDLRHAIHGGDRKNQTRFRQLVVNGVMSTDIMDKNLKELRNKRWNKAFEQAQDSNPKDASDRKATIVIDHIIQASDVAHTMQHWHIYRKWNERLFEEMMKAYLEGRSTTDPAESWYKGELGFFDFYIIPLAKKLESCGVFGVSSFEYLSYAEQNRQEWELRGIALVETMRREIREKLAGKRKESWWEAFV